MFIRTLCLAAAAAALAPAQAASPFTLEQALSLATQRSEATRAARAAVAGAAETARAAGQLPDPVFQAGIDNLPVTGSNRLSTAADFMTMRRIGLSQEWLSAEKRLLREAAAEAALGREAAGVQTALADARLQTALAYIETYYVGQALRLAELTERHMGEEVEAATARLRASAGNGQEALASATARGLAEDDSAETRQAHAAARVALQRWIGEPVEAVAEPAAMTPLSEADYVARHPAVVVGRREVEMARAQADLTRSDRKPNWTWQVSYGQRAGRSDMLSVGVNIPLAVAPAQRQDRDTAAKLALVDKAEAALEETRRAAAAEFARLAGDARRLAERVDRYRQAVLAPAQQREAVAVAGLRSNQVLLMTLFEARQAQVAAQRRLLTLQKEHAMVRAQLAFRPVTGGEQ